MVALVSPGKMIGTPRRNRRVRSAAFSPNDIAGLELWFETDYGVQKDDGMGGYTAVTSADDAVKRWLNRVGSNHLTQATPDSRPLWKLNRANGQAGIYFDGSDDGLVLDTGMSSNTFTLFIVARSESATNGVYFTYSGDSLEHVALVSPDAYYVRGLPLVTKSATYNQFNIIEVKHTGTEVLVGVNGVDGTPDARTEVFRPDRVGLYNSTYGLLGDFCGLLWYDSAISDEDRSAVRQHWGTKYGVAV